MKSEIMKLNHSIEHVQKLVAELNRGTGRFAVSFLSQSTEFTQTMMVPADAKAHEALMDLFTKYAIDKAAELSARLQERRRLMDNDEMVANKATEAMEQATKPGEVVA